jgi:heme/copper-type cytochrome/quinol oxidase subunit 3
MLLLGINRCFAGVFRGLELFEGVVFFIIGGRAGFHICISIIQRAAAAFGFLDIGGISVVLRFRLVGIAVWHLIIRVWIGIMVPVVVMYIVGRGIQFLNSHNKVG